MNNNPTPKEELITALSKIKVGGGLNLGRRLAIQIEDKISSHYASKVREASLPVITDIIQSWLDSQEDDYFQEDVNHAELTDDTHVRSFPEYPTRGTLKNWIKALKGVDEIFK